MARVLYVGVGSPWLGGAGYLLRQHMLLRALNEAAEDLHLAMFDPSQPNGAPYGRTMTALSMPSVRPEPNYEYQLRNVFDPRPFAARTSDCRCSREQVASLRPHEFDVVFAYRIDFAHYAGVIEHPRLLIDIDDPEHVRRGERMQALNVNDLFSRWDLSRLRRFERRIVRRAVGAFVCQEHDQRGFEPKPIVVPNCVCVPADCPARQAQRPRILFVGGMDGTRESPNVDAILWFIEQAWPKVLEEVPQGELHLAGTIGPTVQEAVAGQSNVRGWGFVADLHQALRESSLSIAPIRFGTGTRLKILESMAWGCPVVSTRKGCEGLAVQHGRDLFIGNSPEEFARWCAILLKDRELQRATAHQAHALVLREYDTKQRHPWLVDLLRNSIEQALRR